MFQSLEDNCTIDVANNLTYQNDSKLLKYILIFRFYVKIQNIMHYAIKLQINAIK